MKKIFLLLMVFCFSYPALAQPIPSSYFGMGIENVTGVACPKLSFGIIRLWDSRDGATLNVYWNHIETSRGVYVWTHLDAIVATAQLHVPKIIYTFGYV